MGDDDSGQRSTGGKITKTLKKKTICIESGMQRLRNRNQSKSNSSN